MLISRSVITLGVILFATFFLASNLGQAQPMPLPPVVKLDIKQAQCIATAIYYEARNEPLAGQVAVAKVIMNRVLHKFAKDPCSVVYQRTPIADSSGNIVGTLCQFSWVCENRGQPSIKSAKYAQALAIATEVMITDKWDNLLPNNVLFFHAITAAPQWVYKKVTTIGNHVFYSKGREKKVTSDKKP